MTEVSRDNPIDNSSSIEAEIAELSKTIEQKRKLLEESKGVFEDKEVLRQAVGEKISEHAAMAAGAYGAAQKTTKTTHATGSSYLDNLDEESIEQINHLLGLVFSKGINEAIKEASLMPPFIIDAFHDALVDKLYNELKERGIVK